MLIPKGISDNLESIATFRLICVLNVMDKMFEMLIKERLVAEPNEKNPILKR